MSTPAAVVQSQLDAYNARNVDALLQAYAPDAELVALGGERLARGHAELRARFAERFAEPHLHAQLVARHVIGDVVVDVESVTRDFPDGPGTLEVLCVYEVANGRIVRATFATGALVLREVPGRGL